LARYNSHYGRYHGLSQQAQRLHGGRKKAEDVNNRKSENAFQIKSSTALALHHVSDDYETVYSVATATANSIASVNMKDWADFTGAMVTGVAGVGADVDLRVIGPS
jgi:hypothetical protein